MLKKLNVDDDQKENKGGGDDEEGPPKEVDYAELLGEAEDNKVDIAKEFMKGQRELIKNSSITLEQQKKKKEEEINLFSQIQKSKNVVSRPQRTGFSLNDLLTNDSLARVVEKSNPSKVLKKSSSSIFSYRKRKGV